MLSPEQLRLKRADARFQICEKTERDWRFNRDLYFRVGEQWHWIDKRPWTDAQWKEYAGAPELRTFAAYYDYALARRDDEDGVEIAYFGLLPEFIGRGLNQRNRRSLASVASACVGTTCNRDHPQALANYQARGMVVYKIEESAE
jgi:hypothetical protein